MQIRQLLLHLRATASERQVGRDTGLARNTIRRYRRWAREQGLLTGDLPTDEMLQARLDQTLPPLLPPQNVSSVEPYRELVQTLRQQGVEMRALHARLQERGYTGSYSSVYRFVRTLEPSTPNLTVRVETPPAYEAQVDFGEVGRFVDPARGTLRKAYVFVMTLSFSRHLYAELVFDQKSETWLGLHVRALAFFGGVPQRIVLDNLKAAITRAAWDAPAVQRAYAELAEHYGFLLAPCRPATPQHKGKVESGVHFVQRNFLAGREREDLPLANRALRQWCLRVGERVHGTTKQRPYERFTTVEKPLLKPLPPQPYDAAIFQAGKLHRDGHVVFEGSFYSAPFRLVGQTLWVRAGLSRVCLYDPDHRLVATHPRASQPGERHTCPEHLPPHKLAGWTRNRQSVREQAQQIGPSTRELVEQLLSDPVVDKLSSAGRLLRLTQTYPPERVESACRRALCFSDPTYRTVQRILAEGLDQAPIPPVPQAPVARAFVRSARELLGHLLGGGR